MGRVGVCLDFLHGGAGQRVVYGHCITQLQYYPTVCLDFWHGGEGRSTRLIDSSSNSCSTLYNISNSPTSGVPPLCHPTAVLPSCSAVVLPRHPPRLSCQSSCVVNQLPLLLLSHIQPPPPPPKELRLHFITLHSSHCLDRLCTADNHSSAPLPVPCHVG